MCPLHIQPPPTCQDSVGFFRLCVCVSSTYTAPANLPRLCAMFSKDDDLPVAAAVAVSDGHVASSSAAPSAPPLPPLPPASPTPNVNPVLLSSFLGPEGYPAGLISALVSSSAHFPKRIWIVDNSGSMATEDGHRSVGEGDNTKFVNCTRWRELGETVSYHASLSGRGGWETEFRLLNRPNNGLPQRVTVRGPDDVPRIDRVMTGSRPGGCTPLTAHLMEIRSTFDDLPFVEGLRERGQRVVVVIATDGMPTDEQGYANELVRDNFKRALDAFVGLPVWIVVRLCTDDDQVTSYYNSIDEQLEIDIDVLDDIVGEAEEVNSVNPFINYCSPLHRLR